MPHFREGRRKGGLLSLPPWAQGWFSASSEDARPGILWVPVCIVPASGSRAPFTGHVVVRLARAVFHVGHWH